MAEWAVDVDPELVAELDACFQLGPLDEDGKRLAVKKFAGQINGLKIEIFSNEHSPPHFRVKHGAESCNYRIDNCRPCNPERGLKKFHRNIKKWHSKNKNHLIKTWNETRPSGCPVGEYNASDGSSR